MNNPELKTEEEIIESTEVLTSNISHKDEIETVIYSLEENDSAMVQKIDEGYIWKFQYGSVEIFVQLTGENDDDLLTVWSVVLSLPVNNENQLMRQLLEMNWSDTFETCFAIMNEQVVVSTQRTIHDLSPSEVSRSITLVATIADQYDDSLQEQYKL